MQATRPPGAVTPTTWGLTNSPQDNNPVCPEASRMTKLFDDLFARRSFGIHDETQARQDYQATLRAFRKTVYQELNNAAETNPHTRSLSLDFCTEPQKEPELPIQECGTEWKTIWIDPFEVAQARSGEKIMQDAVIGKMSPTVQKVWEVAEGLVKQVIAEFNFAHQTWQQYVNREIKKDNADEAQLKVINNGTVYFKNLCSTQLKMILLEFAITVMNLEGQAAFEQLLLNHQVLSAGEFSGCWLRQLGGKDGELLETYDFDQFAANLTSNPNVALTYLETTYQGDLKMLDFMKPH